MTKKLEDILNLPNVKEAFKEVDKKEKDKKLKRPPTVARRATTWIHRPRDLERVTRSLTR